MVHGDRSVDVFVRKLRSKLEKVSPSWRYIHTHFGIGYRFAAEPVEEPVGASLPVPEPAAGELPASVIGPALEAAPEPEYVRAH
jgi:DNA-binding winged helix-turn-helix (wHTH) protein